MTQPSNPRKNPFVGPRSFREGELLHGRSRETIQLANLLIAERIILLYSPSGAGKTSLIQAALLPKLKTRHFSPLPVMRVNLEPPPDLLGVKGFNRYIFSVLSSLEQHQPASVQIPDVELVKYSLDAYLRERGGRLSGDDEKAIILVFDQFEEILTIDAAEPAQKQAFFEQLGAALEDPNRWALFSMREDYIAGLDPYLLAIPTNFRNTFRLDLLRPDTARRILQQTTLQEEVTFTDQAADRLIADLSKVRVQNLDGSIIDKAGISIEPVQMQVVCYNLWEKLDLGVDRITLDEIEAIGDVDQALGDYYSTQVTSIALREEVPERTLRRWFDQVLITPSGIRNQVLLEQNREGGLANEVIYRLEDAHLVRLESGRNRTWVELAHDRLVAPVRRSNADWFDEHLSTLQRQSSHWHAENRPEHLLLRGETLLQAQVWAKKYDDDLLPEEKEFLEASRDSEEKEKAAQQLAEADRRSKTQRRFIILITLALLAAIFFAINSFLQSNEARSAEAEAKTQQNIAEIARGTSDAASTKIADQAATERELRGIAETQIVIAETARAEADANAAEAQQNEDLANAAATLASNNANLAFSRQLAAQGKGLLANQPDLAALLAVESYAAEPGWENKSLLLEIVQQQERQAIEPYGPPLPEESARINAFALSPDGERLAWGSGGQVTVWNYRTHDYEPGWDGISFLPSNVSSNVYSLAFSPDGSLLVCGYGANGHLYVVDLATQEIKATLDTDNQSRALAFHPTDPWLAVAVLNRLHLWNTETWEEWEENDNSFVTEADWINDIAWSPDGNKLAYTLSADNNLPNEGLGLWSRGSSGDRHFQSEEDPLHQVSWSPDGNLVAAASSDGSVRFLDVNAGVISTQVEVPDLNTDIYAVAFSPDGRTFARGGADLGFSIFSTQDFKQITHIESPINGWIKYLDYFPEAGFNLLAAVSEYPDLSNLKSVVSLYLVNPTLPLGVERQTGTGAIQSLAVDPKGEIWLARQDANNVRVVSEDGSTVLFDQAGVYDAAALSPDASRLALWPSNSDVEIYELTTGERIQTLQTGNERGFNLVFSPDSESLVLLCGVNLNEVGSCAFQELQQWNIMDGTRAVSLRPQPEVYLGWNLDESPGLAISPSEDYIAAGFDDGSIHLLGRRYLEGVLQGHQRPVTSLAFSSDGSMLASGSSNGNLILWDLTGFQQLGSPLNPGRGALTSLVFSADGRQLLAGYEDGSLWEWNVDEEFWVEIACENVAGERRLTDAEQAQYLQGEEYKNYCDNRN